MNLNKVRLSRLVVWGVLSYAACGCSGSGRNGASQDAAGAAGASDDEPQGEADDEPQGGADDGGQSPGRALPRDPRWYNHPAPQVDFDGLGGDCECDAGKPRVAAPLPWPVPTPSPEMAR
ncbi:MAG: hypothetical protein ABUL62_19335 [Myxococcales bacterium]